jgi:hypothetical protein
MTTGAGMTGRAIHSEGVPRGPSEWGEVLYEPEWASQMRFDDIMILVIGVIVIGLGPIMVAMDIYLPSSETPFGGGPVLTVLAIIVFAMGLILFVPLAKKMPFRIYSKGFTLPAAPSVMTGLLRRESLIPFESVSSVEVGARSLMGIAIHYISIKYESSPGKGEVLDLAYADVDDPLAVMLVLRAFVPTKLGKSLDPYLGPGAEDRVLSVPLLGRGMSKSERGVAQISGLLIFIAIISGLGMGGAGFSAKSVMLGLGLLISMSLVFIPFAQFLARRQALGAFGAEARLARDTIAYPVPLGPRMLISARASLPLTEVVEVRKVLDPLFYGHKALVVTARGERLSARYGLFEALAQHRDFERVGFDLRNTRAPGAMGRPIATWSWEKGTVQGLLGVLLALLVGLATGPSGGRALSSMHVGVPYIAMAMLAVFVPIIVYIYVQVFRRDSLGDGLLATDKGITLPVPPEGNRWLPSEMVTGITTDRDYLGMHLKLETALGTFKLPLRSAARLQAAGYVVEDPIGALQTGMPPTTS